MAGRGRWRGGSDRPEEPKPRPPSDITVLKAMQAEARRRREAAEAGSPVPQEESLIASPGVAEAMRALEAARAREPGARRPGKKAPVPPAPAPSPAPSPGSSGEGWMTTAEMAAYLLRGHEEGQARRAREAAAEAAAAPSSTPSPPPPAPVPPPSSTPPPPSATTTSTPTLTKVEGAQGQVDPDVDPGADAGAGAAPDTATRGVAVMVRLHPSERETWHQAARAAGYGKTAWWVRDVMNAVAAGERADPARPAPAPAARVLPLEVQRTLTGIGTNLNQLARRANGEAREGAPGTVSDAEVDRALEAMDRLTLALKDALG